MVYPYRRDETVYVRPDFRVDGRALLKHVHIDGDGGEGLVRVFFFLLLLLLCRFLRPVRHADFLCVCVCVYMCVCVLSDASHLFLPPRTTRDARRVRREDGASPSWDKVCVGEFATAKYVRDLGLPVMMPPTWDSRVQTR